MVQGKKKKILIVEDEIAILDLLAKFLRRNGYDVFTADDGNEGFNLVKKELPHLAILDLMLPGMDGSDIAANMLADPLMQKIPVIFLTGVLTKAEQERKGTLIGKRCIIAKPCRLEEVLLHVRDQIGPAV